MFLLESKIYRKQPLYLHWYVVDMLYIHTQVSGLSLFCQDRLGNLVHVMDSNLVALEFKWVHVMGLNFFTYKRLEFKRKRIGGLSVEF